MTALVTDAAALAARVAEGQRPVEPGAGAGGWSSPQYQPYTLVVPGDEVQTRGRPWAVVTASGACPQPLHDGCTLMHRAVSGQDGPVWLPPLHCTAGSWLWTRCRVVPR